MALKFALSLALFSVASAGVVDLGYNQNYYQPAAYHQPAYVQSAPTIIKQVQPAVIKKVAYEHEAPANYEFNYDVHDTHTGDIKQQHEVAKDGAISGQYSLIDADGYRRTVSYTADDHHGFQANVQREPVDHKVVVQQPQKVVAKVFQPATLTKVIQPATVSKVYQPASYPQHGYQSASVYENHGNHYSY